MGPVPEIKIDWLIDWLKGWRGRWRDRMGGREEGKEGPVKSVKLRARKVASPPMPLMRPTLSLFHFILLLFLTFLLFYVLWALLKCLCDVSCGRFTFELDVDHKVELMPALTLKAKHGIKLIFTERNIFWTTLLGRPEPPFRTGLRFTRDVFFLFFRQPYLRGPSADRRETLPHDRNLAGIAQ